MGTPVRVLILYDSPETSQLLVRELQRGGYEPLFERVASREAMRQALSSGSWDVILSDYRLRDFDALAALALLKESELDIPLLVVCAGIGEETAVRLIKAGATNCIPLN
ncbi:MAG TPA: response regulator, partial [Thermoanaerobaculia bacterium]|nr:response regulator [Thermoanaerobaculia bacterium]